MIYNPVAGPRDVHRAVNSASAFLNRSGWRVDLRVTERPGDGIRFTREAAGAGCDAVIVAGGDGTVNEAVNGLVGTETALGVLPVGTGNLWAKQLGLPTYTLANPLRLRETTAGLIEASVRPVDVGWMNGRHFLCWAGIGLDAQVTAELEPRQRHTKRLGALPYIIAAVMVARRFPGVRTRVEMDGNPVRGRTLLVLVSNIQQYTLLPVAREARMDDGKLDVFIFKGLGFSYAISHALKLLSQRHLQDPQIVHRQAQRVDVLTEWAIPVQADGDPLGTTPVAVRVVPQALRVLVPPGAPATLFGSELPQGERL